MSNLKSCFVRVLSLLVICTSVNANASEWNYHVLGPSFSLHTGTAEAPITSSLVVTVLDCEFNDLRREVCTSSLEANMERKWSQSNPSLGLMASRSSKYGDGQDIVWGSAVRDSFGEMGFMAGIGRKWPMTKIGRFEVSGGIGGGFWSRTVATGENLYKEERAGSKSYIRKTFNQKTAVYWAIDQEGETIIFKTDLARRTIPFVLPFIAIEDEKGGLGLNISLLPKIANIVPTWTLMAQLTYKL